MKAFQLYSVIRRHSRRFIQFLQDPAFTSPGSFLCPFTESRLIWLDVARPVWTECMKAGEPAATTYHRFGRDNPRRQGMAISVLRVLPSLASSFPTFEERRKLIRILISRGSILFYLVSYGLVPMATTRRRIILLRGSGPQRPAKGASKGKIITAVRRQPVFSLHPVTYRTTLR